MKNYDVQTVTLPVNHEVAFDYIADRYNLPTWTYAFADVTEDGALMRTPAGEVGIQLEVKADSDSGVIDWLMKFPDGTTGKACSRVVAIDAETCVYSFTLLPPEVPLKDLEGTLRKQSRILRDELDSLRDHIRKVTA